MFTNPNSHLDANANTQHYLTRSRNPDPDPNTKAVMMPESSGSFALPAEPKGPRSGLGFEVTVRVWG